MTYLRRTPTVAQSNPWGRKNLRTVFNIVQIKPNGNLKTTNLGNIFVLHFPSKKCQSPEFVQSPPASWSKPYSATPALPAHCTLAWLISFCSLENYPPTWRCGWEKPHLREVSNRHKEIRPNIQPCLLHRVFLSPLRLQTDSKTYLFSLASSLLQSKLHCPATPRSLAWAWDRRTNCSTSSAQAEAAVSAVCH